MNTVAHRRPSFHRDIEVKPSMRSYALKALLRLTLGKQLADDADVAALRRHYERLDARQFKVGPPVERTPTETGGVPGEWIAAPETLPERVILYLHGGSFAFRFPNAHASLAARLCRRLQARALIPDYRLAPEHPYPAAPDDCHAAYRGLLAEGVDPSVDRKAERRNARIARNNTFEAVAKELMEKFEAEGDAPTTLKKKSWLLDFANKEFGKRPIAELKAPEILDALRKIEKRGKH